MPKITVFTCPHCDKVRKFGEFIEKPAKLLAAIESGDVVEHPQVCEDCKATNGTNRLLPVIDKNERQLAAACA